MAISAEIKYYTDSSYPDPNVCAGFAQADLYVQVQYPDSGGPYPVVFAMKGTGFAGSSSCSGGNANYRDILNDSGADWAAAGFVCVAIEYHGKAENLFGDVTYPGTTWGNSIDGTVQQNIRRAVDAFLAGTLGSLSGFRCNPSLGIIAFGGSSGGHNAFNLAMTDPRFTGAIQLSGLPDVVLSGNTARNVHTVDYMRGTFGSDREKFSDSRERIKNAPNKCPFYIAGSQVEFIDQASPSGFYDQCVSQGIPAWLRIVAGGGHSMTSWPYVFGSTAGDIIKGGPTINPGDTVAKDAVRFAKSIVGGGSVAATHLGFSVQPANTTDGIAVIPPVEVSALNSSNALDPTWTGTVLVSLEGLTVGDTGVLSGTAQKQAVAGKATFNDLVVRGPGRYDLKATDLDQGGGVALAGWAMQRFDAARSSYNPAEIVLTTNNVNYKNGGLVQKWACQLPAGVTPGLSSPAVVGGVVYIGASDGKLYAINETTGALLWTYTTGGPIKSSPAVGSGLVMFGSDDGTFYSVNTATHTLAWSVVCGQPVQGSPAISGADVYWGSGATGMDTPNQTAGKLWSRPVVGGSGWEFDAHGGVPAPCIGPNGSIYIGSGNGSVYKVDRDTHAAIWEFKTIGPVLTNVSIGKDPGGTYRVVIGSCYLPYQEPNGHDGLWYVLDSTTAEQIWSFQSGGEIYAGASLWQDQVIAVTHAGTVWEYYLAGSGTPPNHFTADAATNTITVPGKVFVTNEALMLGPDGAQPFALPGGLVWYGSGLIDNTLVNNLPINDDGRYIVKNPTNGGHTFQLGLPQGPAMIDITSNGQGYAGYGLNQTGGAAAGSLNALKYTATTIGRSYLASGPAIANGMCFEGGTTGMYRQSNPVIPDPTPHMWGNDLTKGASKPPLRTLLYFLQSNLAQRDPTYPSIVRPYPTPYTGIPFTANATTDVITGPTLANGDHVVVGTDTDQGQPFPGGLVAAGSQVAGTTYFVVNASGNTCKLSLNGSTPVDITSNGAGRVEGYNIVNSSPAVINGRIYVGCEDSRVYCWGLP